MLPPIRSRYYYRTIVILTRTTVIFILIKDHKIGDVFSIFQSILHRNIQPLVNTVQPVAAR